MSVEACASHGNSRAFSWRDIEGLLQVAGGASDSKRECGHNLLFFYAQPMLRSVVLLLQVIDEHCGCPVPNTAREVVGNLAFFVWFYPTTVRHYFGHVTVIACSYCGCYADTIVSGCYSLQMLSSADAIVSGCYRQQMLSSADAIVSGCDRQRMR